jgi:CBS domain-containing protein
MAERRTDAALVVENDRVIGIFTSTDTARALAATLHALAERR